MKKLLSYIIRLPKNLVTSTLLKAKVGMLNLSHGLFAGGIYTEVCSELKHRGLERPSGNYLI